MLTQTATQVQVTTPVVTLAPDPTTMSPFPAFLDERKTPTFMETAMEGIEQDREIQAEEDAKEDLTRRIKRRHMCGQHIDRYFDVVTNRWRRRRFYCGLYQDGFCLRCAERRKRYLERLACNALWDHGSLKVIEGNAERVNKLCRKLGKDNYQRRPTTKGVTLLVRPDKTDEGREITDIDDGLDWDLLSNTPAGENISGNLGREKAPLREGEVEIKVPLVAVAPVKGGVDLDALEALAVSRAIALVPEDFEVTADNVQQYVDEMTANITAFIQEGGGKILSFGRRTFNMRVEISGIHLNMKREVPSSEAQIQGYLKQDIEYISEDDSWTPF